MALTFVSLGSNRVAVAANSSHNSLANWTAWQWVYPTGNANGERFWHKANAATTEEITVNWSGSGRLLSYVRRATTDSLQFTDDFTTNAWQFFVTTFDAAAGQGLRMYRGTLTTSVVECTYVGVNTNGSGAVITSDGQLTIGNRVAADRSFAGRQANFGFLNRTLTLAEITALQFAPRNLSGTVIYQELGYAGTATHPDWSGHSNSGTVTGATVGAHVPLGPAFSADVEDVQSAAFAARRSTMVGQAVNRASTY